MHVHESEQVTKLTPVFIDLEQGSPEWHAWRNTVLGASDAGTIMGVNPWKKPEQLYAEKKGLVEREPENERMRRGTELEPSARTEFLFQHGWDMQPKCFTLKEYPFIGASLDGWDTTPAGENVGLEIKCGTSIYAKMAAGHGIPAYYWAQLQQQLLGLDWVYFWVCNPEDCKEGILTVVKPDVDYQRKLLDALVNFQNSLESDTPPDDGVQVRNDDEWLKRADDYLKACYEVERWTRHKEAYIEALIGMATTDKTRGGGLLLTKCAPRRPSIRWEQAAKDLADVLGEPVSWEKYRPVAESSEPVWRITKDKE